MKHRYSLMAAVLVLALASMACNINVNIPAQVTTGPTQELEINASLPEDQDTTVNLTLEFGAGEMVLNPGAEDALVTGTATYNVDDFEPEINTSGSSVTITQGDGDLDGFYNFQNDLINEWDLQIANVPLELKIAAGAYTGSFELGGLSIERLEITDGASDVNASFSELNNVEMSSFTYSTGASSVDLTGLANANFAEMTFTSGAGDYTLSFDGELQRDANIKIESGVSSITIIIPEGFNAHVTFEGAVSSVDTDGEWSQDGDVYTLSGSGPTLTFVIEMGAGSLNLKTE